MNNLKAFIKKLIKCNKTIYKVLKILNLRISGYSCLKLKINNFNLHGIFNTYFLLDDDSSKDILVKVLKYRFTETPEVLPTRLFHNRNFDNIEKICKEKENCFTQWEWKFNLYNLTPLNYSIKFYSPSNTVYTILELKQYSYEAGNVCIKVEEGDFVIDGGACYGENTLFFANNVGVNGKIFAFEFLPDNLKIFNKNLNLNRILQNRITLFQNALWDNPNENLYVLADGPATSCKDRKFSNDNIIIKTITIDTLVKEQKIKKIDFIKLDIEGSELKCLEGAKETIKKFKPKLAISLYHKDEDFIEIPKYLKELVPEYKLYLNHYSQCEWETVLYATVQNSMGANV